MSNESSAAKDLGLARAASEANRKRAETAEEALASLMRRLDHLPEEADGLFERLRQTKEYKDAAHVIGWDVD